MEGSHDQRQGAGGRYVAQPDGFLELVERTDFEVVKPTRKQSKSKPKPTADTNDHGEKEEPAAVRQN